MWTLLPFQKPHTCPLAPLSWQCLVLRAVLQTQLHQGTVVHAGSPASLGTTLVQDFGSSWPHLPEPFLTSPQRLLSLLPSQPARNMALSSMFRAGQVQESSSRPSHRVVSGPVSCCSSSSGRTVSPLRQLEGSSPPARRRSMGSCRSMEKPWLVMVLLWDQLPPLYMLGMLLPHEFSPRSGLWAGDSSSWPQRL